MSLTPPCMISTADLQPGDVVVGQRGLVGTFRGVSEGFDLGAGSFVTAASLDRGEYLNPDERLLLLYREPLGDETQRVVP